MRSYLISEATKRNWKRLNFSKEEISNKLSSRANKSNSLKKFIPKEYSVYKSTIEILNDIILYAEEKNLSIEHIIYNLSLNLLYTNKLIKISKNKINSDNKYLKKILEDFNYPNQDAKLIHMNIPKEERDFLGIVYQSLMSEGNKNKKGSYYTPIEIIKNLIENLEKNNAFLDPCCGTGSFLLAASEKIQNPDKIYGFDIDNIACFISKINLIIFFKNKIFKPNIYNLNFFEKDVKDKFKTIKFDFIATNPPWGAKINKKDNKNIYKESFSLCIVQSRNFLNNNGKCSFLLPKSILNVKSHKNIREFILDKFFIEEIQNWGNIFSGVLTDVVSLKLNVNQSIKNVKIIEKNKIKYITPKAFEENSNKKFLIIDNNDYKILKHIFNKPYATLKKSTWGLGIVTGNNSKYVSKNKQNGEKIYMGKEIEPYIINESENYIVYDRNSFQQTAPDTIYRAKEKLVYKFISKKLNFAYDSKQRLFLNSANILIPNVETHSIYTILAFLNSKVFQYIYKNLFDELKVLRSNLEDMPFPYLDSKIKCELETHVNLYMQTRNEKILDSINNIIFKCFDLNQSEKDIIEKF